jgi:hypothetical protein
MTAPHSILDFRLAISDWGFGEAVCGPLVYLFFQRSATAPKTGRASHPNPKPKNPK